MDARELKIKYKKELDFVINELNNCDFYGIISGGAPLDEFEGEARRILVAAKKAKDPQELRTAIHKIFVKAFGPEDFADPLEFRKMAKRIFREVRY